MTLLLEWIQPDEVVPLALIVLILRTVGAQMAEGKEKLKKAARGVGAAAFILYGILGVMYFSHDRASGFLELTIRALLAGAVAHALASVFVPTGWFLHRYLLVLPQERAAEREARRKLEEFNEEMRQRELNKQRLEDEAKAKLARQMTEDLANRPPPPTPDEIMAAAKQRHDDAVRRIQESGLTGIELQAALEKVQQKYLRELDEVMG